MQIGRQAGRHMRLHQRPLCTDPALCIPKHANTGSVTVSYEVQVDAVINRTCQSLASTTSSCGLDDRRTNRQEDRQTQMHRCKGDRQIEVGRRTDGQTDRQTDRRTDRKTDRQTETDRWEGTDPD